MTGVLTVKNGAVFLVGDNGESYLTEEKIWDGYVTHWENQVVHARKLSQTEYDSNQSIFILWQAKENENIPFFELYYNERLVKYSASTFGHNAINIGGNIFNFSHYMNENEVMTPEEYFYRPALGEFAPSPTTGAFSLNENGKNYYDKFGRNFMRTIHVLRVEGIDETRLSNIYLEELETIHQSEPHPKDPEKYRDFNFFNRSCTTIIRDGLRKYGLKKISGIFPRDFFVNASSICLNMKEFKTSLFTMPQLMVDEAPRSMPTPFMNLCNYFKFKKLTNKII